MDLLDITQWAGTEASLIAYIEAVKRMQSDTGLAAAMAHAAAHEKAAYNDDGTERARVPRLLSMSGDVAVIRISGPLNNSDSWWNQYLGATGYPEIRDALIYAARDAAVNAIVLDIASGGGAVNGCADTGELIQRVDTKIKPITAFSDSAIMSSAYWLGSSARKITISQTAEAGSIGVLIVHQEKTAALEAAGIKPEVIRSGKYKALGNPYEKLSELAREELQAGVDHSAQIFTQHVADRRKVSYAVADSKMGQGRIFPGERALEVGLVDAVGNFDSVVSKAQETKAKEKIRGGIVFGQGASQYVANSKGQPLKQALTEQQLAALAEGGASAEDIATAEAAAQAALAARTPEQVAADAAAAALLVTEATATAAAAAAVLAAAAAAPSADAVVTMLQGQLATAQKSIVDLTVEARDAKTASEAITATHASMRAITVASVDRLRVALGQAAGGADAMSDAELLTAHTALRTQFETKFKAGGVAAVSVVATPDAKGDDKGHSAQRQARIQAARLKK